MANDWNWHGKEEKAVTVIPPVPAIAVIVDDKANEIVIRQRGEMGEEDSIIYFSKSQGKAIAEAILNAIGVK